MSIFIDMSLFISEPKIGQRSSGGENDDDDNCQTPESTDKDTKSRKPTDNHDEDDNDDDDDTIDTALVCAIFPLPIRAGNPYQRV